MRGRVVFVIPILVLGLVVLFLSSVPGLPWHSVDERWGSAVMSGRFDAAGSLMSGEGSRGWAERAEQARDRHGELRGYWSTVVGLSPPGDNSVYRQRLMWGDGYASCVLTRETPDGSLRLLEEYGGCSENVEGPPPGLPVSATFLAAESPPASPGVAPPPPGEPPARD